MHTAQSSSTQILKSVFSGYKRPTKVRNVSISPCIMCVQYIGGCSVHRGCSVHQGDTMSTSGGYHEYIGGIS